MKNLAVRTLTGAVYVSVVIGAIFAGPYVFASLFLIILLFSLNEFFSLIRKGTIRPLPVSGFAIAASIYSLLFLISHHLIGNQYLKLLLPLIILIPIVEIFRNIENPIQNIAFTVWGVIYLAFPFAIFNQILIPHANQPELYEPELLIGMMIIIWSGDTGAYLVGRFLGKHKLIERISPNKTWEGAIGGVVMAILIAMLFFSFFNYLNTLQVILIASLTVIAGTLGDLVESMIKRNFNVKDSGKILPGHGGLLDRFDSLLFAAPVYYVLISLFLN